MYRCIDVDIEKIILSDVPQMIRYENVYEKTRSIKFVTNDEKLTRKM